MQFWCGTKLDHEVLLIGCGSGVSTDFRNLFRTTSGQVYNEISGDSTRSEFCEGHVDLIFSTINLSFQLKVEQ